MKFEWWMFVIGAVLSWGVYVPVLHEGQIAMQDRPVGLPPVSGAVRAFLCVGLAYFLTAVVIPLIAMQMGWAGEPLKFTDDKSNLKTYAMTFSTLGGIAGAAGALCIIFSIKFGGAPLYVAPLVFAGAPIVNAIVSVLWHPPINWSRPELLRGWGLFAAGILLAAVGAGLVLYSKGAIEQAAKKLDQESRAKAAAGAVAQTATPQKGG